MKFYNKKHQLNHSKLHKECKLINVHNKYDITQQFIADFSLINLEVLLHNLNKDKFKAAKEKIDEVGWDVYAPLSKSKLGRLDNSEGVQIWKNTSTLLEGIDLFMKAISEYIKSIHTNRFTKQKTELLELLKNINNWVVSSKTTFKRQQTSRKKFGRGVFFDDLDFLRFLKLVNKLFL